MIQTDRRLAENRNLELLSIAQRSFDDVRSSLFSSLKSNVRLRNAKVKFSEMVELEHPEWKQSVTDSTAYRPKQRVVKGALTGREKLAMNTQSLSILPANSKSARPTALDMSLIESQRKSQSSTKTFGLLSLCSPSKAVEGSPQYGASNYFTPKTTAPKDNSELQKQFSFETSKAKEMTNHTIVEEAAASTHNSPIQSQISYEIVRAKGGISTVIEAPASEEGSVQVGKMSNKRAMTGSKWPDSPYKPDYADDIAYEIYYSGSEPHSSGSSQSSRVEDRQRPQVASDQDAAMMSKLNLFRRITRSPTFGLSSAASDKEDFFPVPKSGDLAKTKGTNLKVVEVKAQPGLIQDLAVPVCSDIYESSPSFESPH